MASNNSGARTPCRPLAVERRPPMLKDLLLRDLDSTSCSSSGFNSFPRQPPATLQRSRSRSRAAAEATVSALLKLLNAVRSSLPSPSSSGSARSSSSQSKKNKAANAEEEGAVVVRVRVKDILRWKSFRDSIDSHDYSVKAVGGERGVAADEGGDGNGGIVGGEDPMWVGVAGNGNALHSGVGPTEKKESELIIEDEDEDEDDEEQQSPVSVLDSPLLFGDKQDSSSLSSFDQSLAKVDRKRERLLQSIKWFESLAAGLEPANLDESSEEDDVEEEEEEEELETKHCVHEHEAKAQAQLSAGKVLKGTKEEMQECVTDMDKEARWIKLDELRIQLGSELELGMLDALLDELLCELVGGSDPIHM